MPGKRIGDILIDLGYLTEDRLSQANGGYDGKAPARIGERLCRQGVVRQEDIAHALAIQQSIPCLQISTSSVSAEALACVPADLAHRYKVLPIGIRDGRLELAMIDPFDLRAVDDLAVVSGREILRRYARPADLMDGLRRCYGTSAARMADSLASKTGGSVDTDVIEGDESVGHLHELAREPSLINLVNLIILEAINDGASDVHIEPFEKQLKVKYRIDGILHEMSPPAKHLQPAIISRIKIMSQLNIAERFVPQDGHIKFAAPGASVDIRVSTVPTVYGESVVMRILDKSNTLRRLDRLGMGPVMLDEVCGAIKRPHGIVLVTGPTGSGKTTTLYAALNQMYTPEKKIITIEDPVEFHLDGINQIHVNVKRGLSFANGLRAILRQDPDIIMVGEIRDGETADIAIRSALTGHLVLSSLHTNDAPSAITRLLDMGLEPFLLATSLEVVVAQRLVRVICDRCVEEYEPTQQTLDELGVNGTAGSTIGAAAAFATAHRAVAHGPVRLRRGRGCQDCHNTGYRGRVGIFEMIRLSESIREMIMSRPSGAQIRRAAGPDLVTMRQDGYRKVLAGVTTIDEVWRVTMDAQEELPAPEPEAQARV